ncbi:MAG: chorismate synthase [Tissierellia bacterium]|nr:chorismate synthase [Tissierellia bacterium]
MSSFGRNLRVTVFGESHGEAIGATVEGLPGGIEIGGEVALFLERRRARSLLDTPRREADELLWVSGITSGRTNGGPVTALVKNTNVRSQDYRHLKHSPRPGHGDYTRWIRQGDYAAFAGGGHGSGRVSVALTALGGLVHGALKKKGITAATHILELGGIWDRPLEGPGDSDLLLRGNFPVLDAGAREEILARLREVAQRGDSLGGTLETAVYGCPPGVGGDWFRGLEGRLSLGIFGIPGVKGISFGTEPPEEYLGSRVNDPFILKEGEVATATNYSGGISGGSANGMPLTFRTRVKPTPSISLPQRTVQLEKMEETTITIGGRHDPSILPRGAVVVTAVTALVLADALMEEYGRKYLVEEI